MVKEIRLKFDDSDFFQLEEGKDEAKAKGLASNWEDYLLLVCGVTSNDWRKNKSNFWRVRHLWRYCSFGRCWKFLEKKINWGIWENKMTEISFAFFLILVTLLISHLLILREYFIREYKGGKKW